MKRKFYQIAKKLGASITSYKTYREPGMGGLQVFEVVANIGDKRLNFDDSYFHLSGDDPKVISQFENELANLKNH